VLFSLELVQLFPGMVIDSMNTYPSSLHWASTACLLPLISGGLQAANETSRAVDSVRSLLARSRLKSVDCLYCNPVKQLQSCNRFAGAGKLMGIKCRRPPVSGGF